MQKVRYYVSSNRLYIKFQGLFTFLLLYLFTFRSHYYSLSILNYLAFRIEFLIFNRIITFYNLLINDCKITCAGIGFKYLTVKYLNGLQVLMKQKTIRTKSLRKKNLKVGYCKLNWKLYKTKLFYLRY